MTQWGLDTLFNPAKRHMDEEKRRLQATREQIGDNSGGRRIDLESGKVVIRRPEDEDEAASAEDAGADEVSAKDEARAGNRAGDDAGDGGSAAAGEQSRPAPSAAAIRAAKRRGRTPR